MEHMGYVGNLSQLTNSYIFQRGKTEKPASSGDFSATNMGIEQVIRKAKHHLKTIVRFDQRHDANAAHGFGP